jgi:hypothetical protein
VRWSVSHLQYIFRRYPNQYESIIATLCDSLDSLDEPEAKVGVRMKDVWYGAQERAGLRCDMTCDMRAGRRCDVRCFPLLLVG